MDDAINYATPRVNDGDVSTTGVGEDPNPEEQRTSGYMKNDVPGRMSNRPIDRAKYYDRLESNLREMGDSQGVINAQKDRERYFSSQKKTQYEDEKRTAEMGEKKSKAGEDRLKYVGAVAKKNLEIFRTQGPEAANAYMMNAQDVLEHAGMIKPEEREDVFDPGKAQVAADLWDKQYGKTATGGKGGTKTTYLQLYQHAKNQGLSDEEAETWADEKNTAKEKRSDFDRRMEREADKKANGAPPEVMEALKSGKYKKVKKGGVLWSLDAKGNPIQVK